MDDFSFLSEPDKQVVREYVMELSESNNLFFSNRREEDYNGLRYNIQEMIEKMTKIHKIYSSNYDNQDLIVMNAVAEVDKMLKIMTKALTEADKVVNYEGWARRQHQGPPPTDENQIPLTPTTTKRAKHLLLSILDNELIPAIDEFKERTKNSSHLWSQSGPTPVGQQVLPPIRPFLPGGKHYKSKSRKRHKHKSIKKTHKRKHKKTNRRKHKSRKHRYHR